MGTKLTSEQRRQIKDLVNKFPRLFDDRIGYTNLIEHVINVTDERTCYQQSFRIPDSMKDAVETELRRIETEGITQFDLGGVSTQTVTASLLPLKTSEQT